MYLYIFSSYVDFALIQNIMSFVGGQHNLTAFVCSVFEADSRHCSVYNVLVKAFTMHADLQEVHTVYIIQCKLF